MTRKLAVRFETRMSASDSCTCDACGEVSRIINITLPETKYHDGNKLSTKYSNYWLCASCRRSLSHALDWPMDADD